MPDSVTLSSAAHPASSDVYPVALLVQGICCAAPVSVALLDSGMQRGCLSAAGAAEDSTAEQLCKYITDFCSCRDLHMRGRY